MTSCTTRRRFLRKSGVGLAALASSPVSAHALAPPSSVSESSGRMAPIAELKVHSVMVRRVYKTKVAPAGGHGEGKEASQYLILELINADGTRGVGEISDVETTWRAPPAAEFARLLSQHLVGADPSARPRLWHKAKQALPAHWHGELRRMTMTAVDMALVDLIGRCHGLPAYQLFGGLYRTHLQVSWVAFIRETSLLEAEIREKSAAGFSAFKLKVGENFADDREHVAAARRIIGPKAHLRVDASGAWQEKEAIEKIQQLVALGVDAVETPIAAAARSIAKDHPERVNDNADKVAMALARVRAAVPAKIIEHVVDFSDAFSVALVKHRAVDVFNVAVSQAGSLDRAQRLIQLAQAGGIDVLLGSTVELGPGTAAALHVGAALKAVSVASDLVGPGLLEGDVITRPLTYDKGRLPVPRRPGLGIELDPKKLAKFA